MRAKWVKQMALVLAASATLAQPLWAQTKTDGYKFLEAVKKRDGNVATQMLDEPGNTLIGSRDVTTGENGLHIAAARRDLTWVRFLLGRGANPNMADKKGVTPLQIASQLGFTDGMEALIDGGAMVDVPNMAGETPLITAVHRRDTVAIRLLIEHGADPNRSDNSGRTARDYAKLMGGNPQVLEEITKAEENRGKKQRTYGPN